MKHIKTYEKWGKEYIIDIREFFSNLKILSYLYKDYYNFLNLFDEIDTKLNTKHSMPFFGFTSEGESQYSPIIDTVTKVLHKIFDMIVKNDYQGIYDWFNDEKNGFFYFDKPGKRPYFTVKNYISEQLTRDLNFLVKPYFSTKFNTYDKYNYNEKINKSKDILEIAKESPLYEKYIFRVWENEMRIIAKQRDTFTPSQLEEIERAKEFGLEKYKHLKPLADAQEHTGKYNL
jgi:hypothetical protein